MTHNEREFRDFMHKAHDRYRNSTGRLFLRRNQYIPTAAETRQANYDQETERWRAIGQEARNERKAS